MTGTKLINYPDIQVISTAGILREKTLTIVGSIADQALKEIYAKKPFMGANGENVELILVTFQKEYYADFDQLFAISLLSMLPILLLFIFFQRKFVEGMFLSSTKG